MSAPGPVQECILSMICVTEWSPLLHLLENDLSILPGTLHEHKQIISQIVAWISLTYRVVIEYLSLA